MSLNWTGEPRGVLVSMAHWPIAPRIWYRLLMQAFFWDRLLARTKLGTAITVARPIMPTTTISSTNEKPDLRDTVIFISNLPVLAARTKLQPSYSHALLLTDRPFITDNKMGALAESGNPGECWKQSRGFPEDHGLQAAV